MPIIALTTTIHAPVQRVFDLSRSIDLHLISTKHTNETAIAGITEGLIGLGQRVTWRAKHLGIYQTLTSEITEFNAPTSFTDEMVAGAFNSFKHVHTFEEKNGSTEMRDIFEYVSPLGLLGKFADFLFLKRYITRLLEKRNETIKTFAESDQWKKILPITVVD